MSLRIFGVVCLAFGHKRDAASRRNVNGNMFAKCSRCGRELYREPIRGVWRAATDQDRRPRGFVFMPKVSDLPPTGDAAARKRRRRTSK